MAEAPDPAALVGTWRLESWRLVAPDGTAVDAFGPAPRGLLIYTAEGTMSVVISAAGRARLPAAPGERGVAARAAAFDGAHAYAGRYSLRPGAVVHHVAVSTMPNYEGVDQHRRLDLDGDRLTLTTPPGQAAHLDPASGIVGCLTWRRVRGE
jgi:hypothetical protein